LIGYDTLRNWFQTNFTLWKFHHLSIVDIERMMPWERQLYVGMLERWEEHQKREVARIKQEMEHNARKIATKK